MGDRMKKTDIMLNYLKYIDKNATEQVKEQKYTTNQLREMKKLLIGLNEKDNFWICFWLFLIWLKL